MLAGLDGLDPQYIPLLDLLQNRVQVFHRRRSVTPDNILLNPPRTTPQPQAEGTPYRLVRGRRQAAIQQAIPKVTNVARDWKLLHTQLRDVAILFVPQNESGNNRGSGAGRSSANGTGIRDHTWLSSHASQLNAAARAVDS
jgi:hypothetical protein